MATGGNFAGIEKKTTGFLLGAAAALFLLVAAAAVEQHYFSQTTSLYFFTSNAQGLNKGMAVKLAGFTVGTVENISMEPTALVRVRLSLLNDYIHFIRQDARARLMKEALIGESVVEILPGTPQSRQVAQNGVLAFERGQDMGELAESLAGQVQPILANLGKITSSISQRSGDIGDAIQNINLASKTLLETSKKLDHVLDQAGNSLDRANHSLKVIDDALPALVLKTDTGLGNIQAATADIRKAASESAGQIPRLVGNSNALMQDGRDILDGAKKSWPVRNILPDPEEEMLAPDTYIEPAPGP